jgi:hypothetical protein
MRQGNEEGSGRRPAVVDGPAESRSSLLAWAHNWLSYEKALEVAKEVPSFSSVEVIELGTF